jgi:uncharacterized protein
MQPLVENLVKLQAIEIECGRLDQDIRSLPAELAQAEAALAEAERQSSATLAALAGEQTLRNRQEREIESHRQKTVRFRAQLDVVKTPAQADAIERELQFATAEISRLEDEELESLERSEKREADLVKSRAEVDFHTAALERTRNRIARRREELALKRTELDADRAALRSRIEPDWLARFDRLAASRGTAVSRAEDSQCTGCRMGIRPQSWNQLRDGQLLACDSCSRLLYWDPTMTPAPKAPQTEPVPGLGRPVRRSSSGGV